jgi:hypothetical protein
MTPPASPLYRVVDVRRDGEVRTVFVAREPAEALAARDALRRAGDATAEVAVAAAVDPNAIDVANPPSAIDAPSTCRSS